MKSSYAPYFAVLYWHYLPLVFGSLKPGGLLIILKVNDILKSCKI